MDKNPDAFRTISEAADDLDLPQHVLRFWETKFAQLKPLKRAGGRRFYRSGDLELLRAVKKLLHTDGYTIRGVQRLLKEKGGRALLVAAHSAAGAGSAHELNEDKPEPLAAGETQSADERPGDLPPFAQEGFGQIAPPRHAAEETSGLDPALLRAVLTEIAACQSILRAARAA